MYKRQALQFAADGCHVYGAYTDGATLPCDGLETVVQLVLDPMDAGSLNRAVELVSSCLLYTSDGKRGGDGHI